MLLNKFRKTHIHKFFSLYEEKPGAPLDLLLNKYLRDHKQIGSSDRKMISNTIFNVVRWRALIDASMSGPVSWETRVELFLSTTIPALQTNPSLTPAQMFSMPEPLYHLIIESLGKEKGDEFCQVLGEQAPITVRVNLLKTTREALFNAWKETYSVSLSPVSKEGICFHKKINFFALPEFTKGLFEIQDEASQLSASLVRAKPKEEILDYCAGAGGKSLAIAPKLQGKGQIFLHDIREEALVAAKKRLKRAGVQNSQIVTEAKHLEPLKGRMDWVIADVPCSGSGTWRRNPDQKWKFSPDQLKSLIPLQREIFDKALPYLSPKGSIVYITCSVFKEENEEQIAYFQQKYGLILNEPPFQSFPAPQGMDGLFAASFSRNNFSSI